MWAQQLVLQKLLMWPHHLYLLLGCIHIASSSGSASLLLLQVNITRPYLCANHLAPPYMGPAASAAAAPSEAPAPQSSAGAAGEGYGAGEAQTTVNLLTGTYIGYCLYA